MGVGGEGVAIRGVRPGHERPATAGKDTKNPGLALDYDCFLFWVKLR